MREDKSCAIAITVAFPASHSRQTCSSLQGRADLLEDVVRANEMNYPPRVGANTALGPASQVPAGVHWPAQRMRAGGCRSLSNQQLRATPSSTTPWPGRRRSRSSRPTILHPHDAPRNRPGRPLSLLFRPSLLLRRRSLISLRLHSVDRAVCSIDSLSRAIHSSKPTYTDYTSPPTFRRHPLAIQQGTSAASISAIPQPIGLDPNSRLQNHLCLPSP